MRNPVTDAELDALYQLILLYFPDNTTGLITPANARLGLQGLANAINASKLRLDGLTTNQVFGSVFRVPTVSIVNGLPSVDMAQVEPRRRILGMEILATNGVSAGDALAGVRADPIAFQLVAYPTGTIDALVDEKPTTTATVKARLVRTSGTEDDRLAQFELLELEDHPYRKGEVVKWVFASGETRLLEWRANSVGFSHPEPTGEEDDPIYAPFAALAPSAATQADVDALTARVKDAELLLGQLDLRLGNVENEQAWFNMAIGSGNICLGRPDLSSNSYSSAISNNQFGSGHHDNAYGAVFQENRLGNNHHDNGYGAFNISNTYGGNHNNNQYGDNIANCMFGANQYNNLFGNNLKNCIFGPNQHQLIVGDNCENVTVLDCLPVNGSPFVVPAGTKDAVFRNNIRLDGGVAQRTGPQLEFDQHAEYAPRFSGTFTVNTATKRVGATVRAYLGPACTQPTLPGADFQLVGGAYASGVSLMYSFCVGGNGKIQYYINQLP